MTHLNTTEQRLHQRRLHDPLLDLSVPQDRSPYAEALIDYATQPWQRLTVPGHQSLAHRNPALTRVFGARVLSLDLPPLIPGVDLPAENNPLDEAQRLAAEAWGADTTWFLSNGASQGNLAACLALRRLGEQVVVQRNVHSSVIDGLALAGLSARFVAPGVDDVLGMAHGVTPAALDAALTEHPQACAAYVVSPSYFGTSADVAALARVTHRHGIPLVVDEAWGAHFGFHPRLPASALACGADLVISSTHKLAGSLSQSAMLHLGSGALAGQLRDPVHRALASVTSTSVSSILLASLDLARRDLAIWGERWIEQSLRDAARIRAGLRDAGRYADPGPRLRAQADVHDLDPLRVVIDTRSGGISGHDARDWLFRHHHVHVEMSTDAALVAVVGAGNGVDADRFLEALHDLPVRDLADRPRFALPAAGPRAMEIRQAHFAATELVGPDDAVGRISADSLAAYPPGVPNVLPGELLTHEAVAFLRFVAQAPNGVVRGACDARLDRLRVVARS